MTNKTTSETLAAAGACGSGGIDSFTL